ncbi:MAG: 50S ribosomal protein L29 [Armatimonadota bacterium]|nr:50S ribosomal protein L29 [Armatimonadota bacterium]MCX7776925.1 50S ribosomal protein L29 [Armatimonadota bacterium]MDW8024758.1 50S ribosomal protein L29 [Armatimonadota bacterium]
MSDEKRREQLRNLRQLSTEELLKELDETRKELFMTRAQVATFSQTNVARIKLLKRKLARILTILRERELLGIE